MVVITCNEYRLACENLDDTDEKEVETLKRAVWVRNTHPLFGSDEATEWLVSLTGVKNGFGGGGGGGGAGSGSYSGSGLDLKN